MCIIITGASRGIGKHIASILVQKYKKSILITASNASKLAAVEQSLKNHGASVVSVVGDLSDPKTCHQIAETAIQQFGKIEAVIHNAATIDPLATIQDMDFSTFEKAIRINLNSAVLLTQLTLVHVKQSQGKYIFVSSGAATRPIHGWSTYCCSKAALLQFCACLAIEEPSVCCVSVRPGVVDTDMQAVIREQGKESMPEHEYEKFVKLKQESKLVDPQMPAEAIAALALFAPKSMSGQFVSYDDSVIKQLICKE